MRGEEEVPFLHQDIRSTAEYLRVVAFAQLWQQDADGLRPEALQRSRDQAGLITELLRRSFDPLAGCRRDGAARRIVQHERDRRRTQVQILGQHLQADTARRLWNGRSLSWHKG